MAPYLSADALRTTQALADEGKFPDADLEGFVAEFEDIAERYRGVAFVSRSATETTTVSRSTNKLFLANQKVIAVTSVTVDGTAVASTAYDLFKDEGIIRLDAGIPRGAVVVVVYTYGYATTPATITAACREYVRSVALQRSLNKTREVISTSVDGTFVRYSTPDWDAGRPTGFMEVDRLLNSAPDHRIPGIG